MSVNRFILHFQTHFLDRRPHHQRPTGRVQYHLARRWHCPPGQRGARIRRHLARDQRDCFDVRTHHHARRRQEIRSVYQYGAVAFGRWFAGLLYVLRYCTYLQIALIVVTVIAELMDIIYLVMRYTNDHDEWNRAKSEKHSQHNRDLEAHFRDFEGVHDPLDEFLLVRPVELHASRTLDDVLIGAVGVAVIALTIAIGVWFYMVIRTANRWMVAKNMHDMGRGEVIFRLRYST